MAFQKKVKPPVVDRRNTKYGAIMYREKKIAALAESKTPEARKARKAMNDIVYRKARSNLNDWFAPNGKLTTARG